MSKANDVDTDDEEHPIVVSRAEWGARPPQSTKKMSGPVADIVYTETDTRECYKKEDCIKLIREIQHYHMDVKGMPDIQHSFLIGGDGNVYEGRGWKNVGPEYGKNQSMPQRLVGKSIEVAFIGKFKDEEPTAKMLKVSQDLIKYGMDSNFISKRKVDEDDTKEDKEDEESEIDENVKKAMNNPDTDSEVVDLT